MFKCTWDTCTKLLLALRDNCMITFARIIQSESVSETSQSKMDTQTAGFQNKLLGAFAHTAVLSVCDAG